jgi:hypothetical protein
MASQAKLLNPTTSFGSPGLHVLEQRTTKSDKHLVRRWLILSASGGIKIDNCNHYNLSGRVSTCQYFNLKYNKNDDMDSDVRDGNVLSSSLSKSVASSYQYLREAFCNDRSSYRAPYYF